MRQSGYAGIESHVREHQQLIEKLNHLERAFTEGSSQVDMSTLELLQRWLNSHVLGSDRSVGPHFHSPRG